MLTEKEIQQALHAHRVVPLLIVNPHGPLGLEELASSVADIEESPVPLLAAGQVRRSIRDCTESQP